MTKKLIDLSQEIYQGMPVYPGHVKTVIWEHHTHKETLKNIGTSYSYRTIGFHLFTMTYWLIFIIKYLLW